MSTPNPHSDTEDQQTKHKAEINNLQQLFRDPWAYITIGLVLILILIFVFDINIIVTTGRGKQEQQKTIPTTTTSRGTLSYLREYAKNLQLDTTAFEACYKEHSTASIDEDMQAGRDAGISGTPGFIINGQQVSGAQSFDTYKEIIEYKRKNTKNSDGSPIINVSTENQPTLGDTNAPITIVEFSDFQCPFCEAFYNDAYQQIKKEYIDTGIVKFVFRDFIIQGHYNAPAAAIAAECANKQEKFFEFHNALFEHQSEWTNGDPSNEE